MANTPTAPGQGLDKQVLVEGIKAANAAVKNLTDSVEIEEVWASKLADAIEAYVKTGKVITIGSAATQTGTIT